MHLTPILITLLTTLTTARASPLTPRQGSSFVAVGNLYSSGGCTSSALIFADPIFGSGNVCQPLDRSGSVPDILSYETLSVSAGCSVALYTDAGCETEGFEAPVGGCVQAGAPFLSAFVTCV